MEFTTRVTPGAWSATDSASNSVRTAAAIFASPGHPPNPHFLYTAHPEIAQARMTASASAQGCLWLLIEVAIILIGSTAEVCPTF
jgi:hypothetical protein